MDPLEIKDPFSENPNAALIAFHLFYDNYFAETQRNNPKLDNTHLHQLLCDLFSRLPPQEKQNYFARAAAEIYISSRKKEKNLPKQMPFEDHSIKSNIQNALSNPIYSHPTNENLESKSSSIESDLRNAHNESIQTEIHKQANSQVPINQISSIQFHSIADENSINQGNSTQPKSSLITVDEPTIKLLHTFYPNSKNTHQLLNEIEFKVNLSSSLSPFDSNCLVNYPLTFVKKK